MENHWAASETRPLPPKWPPRGSGKESPNLDTWGEVKEKMRFSLLRPGASGRRRDLSPKIPAASRVEGATPSPRQSAMCSAVPAHWGQLSGLMNTTQHLDAWAGGRMGQEAR